MRAVYGLAQVVFALLLLTACAGLPPEKEVRPGDVLGLAGEWTGTWSEGSWSGPMTLTIYPGDQVGEFVFATPSGEARSTSRIVVAQGKLILQGDAGKTTLTLHERESRRALIGEYRYDSGQSGTVELWRK